MLRLCSEGANASYFTGDFDTMNKLIDEVLQQDISVEDKFRVYEIKMLALQAAGDKHASLSLGINIRQQLGFYTPPNRPASKLSILWGYIMTRYLLGRRTAEELANLPKLTNARIIMAQRMLELIGLDCYTAQPTLLPLICFLNIKETLKYGINPASSCNAFMGFGVLLCGVFGDPKRGRELALAAELILAGAQPTTTQIISRCTFLCQGCIFHWTTPLHETLAPLLEGYRIGLETGDVQSAGLNQSLYVSHTFFAGRSLGGVDELLSANVGLQNDVAAATAGGSSDGALHTKLTKLDIQLWHLVVAKLRGIEIDESEMNFDGILEMARETGNQGLRGYVFTARLELKVLFSEWDDTSAMDLLVEAGDVRAVLVGIYTGVRFTFLEALILIKTAQAAAQRTSIMWCNSGWKWKRIAQRSVKLIRTWVRRGNVNLTHNLHLLEAELSVLDGDDKMAEDSYQLAIAIASRNGFLQDLALSHELASAYFKSQGDDCRGDYHMDHAIRCYSEWGATAKVSQLTKAKRND